MYSPSASMLVLLLTLTLACTDSGSETPLVGAIGIRVTQGGVEVDPDGFALSLDGTMVAAIAADTAFHITELAPGDHSLSLFGLAPNCVSTPASPATITVAANDTIDVTITIACVATTGTLAVSEQTTGPMGRGPPYYWVYLNGQFDTLLSVGDTALISGLPPGPLTVSLGLLRTLNNCVTADSLRPHVVAGATTYVQFEIACVMNWGDIAVNVPTTGPNQPALLIIRVDDGTVTGAGTSPNVSIGLPAVLAGAHTITISGITSNCALTGPSTRDIVVPLGGTVTVDFAIDCS